MTSPTIKNHTIKCGKLFTLKAYDEHGKLVEHRILPIRSSATPTPPAPPSGTTGPKPIKVGPPVAATVIAGERPEDDLFTLTLPLSELPGLSRDDVERVVAYRVHVTSPVTKGLHIDVPSNALPDIDRSSVVVLGVSPNADGSLE